MTTVTVGDSVGDAVRARLGTWPHDPDVVQIVLVDHHMVPNATAVRHWIGEAAQRNPRVIRTGALFPAAAEAFINAGFRAIDTLVLLEAALDGARWRTRRRPHHVTTQRMRSNHFAETATLDRTAFGDPWGNDERSLRDITVATPRHRARVVQHDGRILGFAITGQSGAAGYLQRLAVHPDARRQGLANGMVTDATDWMQRRGATTAMVNTAVDNEAAQELYAGAGFKLRPETLLILEHTPH